MKYLSGVFLLFAITGCANTCPPVDDLHNLIIWHSPNVNAVEEIIQTGVFDEKQKCCPVKAKVSVGSTFGSQILKIDDYCFYKDDRGDWAIKENSEAGPSVGTVNDGQEKRHEQKKTDIRVTLQWQDDSANELGFEIERKNGPKGIYRKIAVVGPNVTTYRDTGLTEGIVYYYRIRSYNSAGHSSYSGEIVFDTSRQ